MLSLFYFFLLTVTLGEKGLYINKGLKEKSTCILENEIWTPKFLQHFFLGRVRSFGEEVRLKFKILLFKMAGNRGVDGGKGWGSIVFTADAT